MKIGGKDRKLQNEIATGDEMMTEDEVRIPGKEMMTGAVFPGLVFIEKLQKKMT